MFRTLLKLISNNRKRKPNFSLYTKGRIKKFVKLNILEVKIAKRVGKPLLTTI